MVIATKAIVLSSLKFGDSDLIVKCFTASSGLKSYLLRNILKSKKGKLKVSLGTDTQELCEGDPIDEIRYELFDGATDAT